MTCVKTHLKMKWNYISIMIDINTLRIFYQQNIGHLIIMIRQSLSTCVCVVHWHCTAQLSMFNMEKRFRNKIIIIIIIIMY